MRFSFALIMHQAWLIWHSSEICRRDRAGASVTLIVKAHMWIVSHACHALLSGKNLLLEICFIRILTVRLLYDVALSTP